MRCHICDSENLEEEKFCKICNEAFANDGKIGGDCFPKKRVIKIVIAILLIACGALLPWIMRRELFFYPPKIRKAKEFFELVKWSYFNDKKRWDEEKNLIVGKIEKFHASKDLARDPLVFDFIPVEVVFAYLNANLNMFSNIGNICSLDENSFDKHKESFRFYIIKDVSFPWPLSMKASLEGFFQNLNGESIALSAKKLRFGDRKEPLAKAVEYFDDDILKLKSLEMFLRGAKNLRVVRMGNRMHNSVANIGFSIIFFNYKAPRSNIV